MQTKLNCVCPREMHPSRGLHAPPPRPKIYSFSCSFLDDVVLSCSLVEILSNNGKYFICVEASKHSCGQNFILEYRKINIFDKLLPKVNWKQWIESKGISTFKWDTFQSFELAHSVFVFHTRLWCVIQQWKRFLVLQPTSTSKWRRD